MNEPIKPKKTPLDLIGENRWQSNRRIKELRNQKKLIKLMEKLIKLLKGENKWK